MALVTASCSCGWTYVNPVDGNCGFGWNPLSPTDIDCSFGWDKLTVLDSFCESPWTKLTDLDALCGVVWVGTNPVDQGCSIDWAQTTGVDVFVDDEWQFGVGPDISCDFNWDKTIFVDETCDFDWDKTIFVDEACGSVWDRTVPTDQLCISSWTLTSILDVICVTDCSPKPPEETITILCVFPWRAARSYIVIDQNVTFIRVSDSQEVKLLNVTIGADIDSFFWTISGNVASRADLSYIDTSNGPVETQLVINGYTWRFLIENTDENYSYESGGGYSFNGVSPSVELAAPYDTPTTWIETSLKNAKQIVQEQLVATSWNATQDYTDWNIPANVFSVNQQTKMEVISTIAKATGAFVNTMGGFPDGTPYEPRLKIDYRYKETPKDWDTAIMDHTIVDGILSQGKKWEAKPKYDHVFVTGGEGGSFIHVKRSGEPWTKAASSIVDSLITNNNTAREAGRNLLDQEGYDQTIYTMDFPLPDSAVGNPSVMHPGELMEATDLFATWRGMIKGVSIAVGFPGVTQSVEVERKHVVTGVPVTWDNSFTLTIGNANIDTDLTNFPVLIKLSANCGVNSFDATAFFTELQNDGNRRRIKIEDAGTNQCYVEIENYSQINLEAWLWVKVPTVTAAAPTVLTLYYDRDVPENVTYVGDVGSAAANQVWDVNYISVYHLKEDPTGGASGTIQDSCLVNNARPEASMDSSDLVNGRTYKALQFDGVDDYIDCGNDNTIRPNSITVEAWCYSTNTSNKFLVSNPATIAHNYYDYVLRNNQAFLYTTSGAVIVGSRTPVANVWEYLAVTHTSGAQVFFANGLANGASAIAGNLSYETSGVLANTYLACWQPGQNEANIILDEVRISNIARSTAWIKATYHSNTDNLITYT